MSWKLFEFRMWLSKVREKVVMAIVWRLPEKLIHWCVIRAWAISTTGKYSHIHPDDVKWNEALDRVREHYQCR